MSIDENYHLFQMIMLVVIGALLDFLTFFVMIYAKMLFSSFSPLWLLLNITAVTGKVVSTIFFP